MADSQEAIADAFLVGCAWSSAPDPVLSALNDAIARGRTKWPDLALPVTDFAQAVGAAVADDEDPVAAIEGLHCGDLWLASAGANGDRAAFDELDRRLTSLRPTLLRMGVAPDMVADLQQQIRARLFAGTEHRPARIRGYRGRGDLRSWLKVVVARDGMRLVRKDAKVPAASEEVDALMDPAGDPELEAMQGTYRESFRAAFQRALGALSPKDRNVLRYHLVDGLAIDELGAIYRVHRSTAARWLVRIREGLYASTRRELMSALALSPSEFDSVIRMIRSRLDASIASGLR